MKGRKNDSEKVRLELLPFPALYEVARVLTFGAKKYDPWNWASGMAWSRLLGAALRHLFAWAAGEDKDPETGLSHLAHAACCVLFLLTYTLKDLGDDDRHKYDTELGQNLITGLEEARDPQKIARITERRVPPRVSAFPYGATKQTICLECREPLSGGPCEKCKKG